MICWLTLMWCHLCPGLRFLSRALMCHLGGKKGTFPHLTTHVGAAYSWSGHSWPPSQAGSGTYWNCFMAFLSVSFFLKIHQKAVWNGDATSDNLHSLSCLLRRAKSGEPFLHSSCRDEAGAADWGPRRRVCPGSLSLTSAETSSTETCSGVWVLWTVPLCGTCRSSVRHPHASELPQCWDIKYS